MVDVVKRAKIANEAPLRVSQPACFRSWHESSKNDMINHHHAAYASNNNTDHHLGDDHPPISLQYEGFGHFLDTFHSCKDVPSIDKVSRLKLLRAIDAFADGMSAIYDDEYSKRKDGLRYLKDIFSARTNNDSFKLMAASVSKKVTRMATSTEHTAHHTVLLNSRMRLLASDLFLISKWPVILLTPSKKWHQILFLPRCCEVGTFHALG